MTHMFLLFSHRLTQEQVQDAQQQLAVDQFVYLPEALQRLWSQVPPDRESLQGYLAPLYTWLEAEAGPEDLVLVHGDFGLVYLCVSFCKAQGLRPLYATTERLSVEELQPDGSVHTRRIFQHRRFRFY